MFEKFKFIKPSKDLVNKAKTFLYIRHHLVKSDCSLISEHSITRNINRELFWKQNTKRLKKFTFNKDELYNMFIKQLELNEQHLI